MRVALDSSVLIAASISSRGVSAGLLNHILEDHELVLSDFILDEVARKLRAKFRFDEPRLRRVISELRGFATLVDPAPVPDSACRDAGDIPILGTAVAGRTSILVSLDKDLLSLGDYEGILIVRPGEFWSRGLSREREKPEA